MITLKISGQESPCLTNTLVFIAATQQLIGRYQRRRIRCGGITEQSAPEWLAFKPVLCVGGSWVT
ncbi:MAG: hypothetical protein EOO77_40955, partial [Oxalobacteraceae bacterium]